MFYLTSIAVEGSEEALAVCTQEQRRVKGTVCKLLLVHQLVNSGLLCAQAGARVVAQRGGRVKRITK